MSLRIVPITLLTFGACSANSSNTSLLPPRASFILRIVSSFLKAFLPKSFCAAFLNSLVVAFAIARAAGPACSILIIEAVRGSLVPMREVKRPFIFCNLVAFLPVAASPSSFKGVVAFPTEDFSNLFTVLAICFALGCPELRKAEIKKGEDRTGPVTTPRPMLFKNP